MLKFKPKSYGFTIIELLVVIVVIGVLATITVVSYNGISKKAVLSGCQSDMSSAKKKIEMYNIEQGNFPDSLVKAGVKNSDVCDLSYYLNNNINPAGYVIYGEKDSIRLIATSTSMISEIVSVDAEGGIISDDGEYRIHKFITDGIFKINSSNEVVVELLVVAGGGGGGSSKNGGAGGGGAGGLIHYDNYLVPANTDINVKVGAGGSPGTSGNNLQGSNGIKSEFGQVVALGGGGGGSGGNNATLGHGRSGGSGGGAGYNGYNLSGNSLKNGGSGTSEQGHNGGSTTYFSNENVNTPPCTIGSRCGAGGAGGGGAGGEGNINFGVASGGVGGIGLDYSISGSLVTYSQGGRAGSNTQLIDSPSNTGKGGDGAYNTSTISSKAGGSGVVIVRYKR